MAVLEPLHRLVFLGLISMADDKGRLVDSVRMINGFIFPFTDDDSRESIEILTRLKRVLRYTSESGQKLIQITNWEAHQRVTNPSPYNLPAPPPEAVEGQTVMDLSVDPNENLDTSSVDPQSTITIYDHDLRSTNNSRKADQRPSFEGEFDEFWNRYPLKVGKKAALKAYQARRREGIEQADILEGLTRYLAYKEASQERHHNPSTFLGPNHWFAEEWLITEELAAKRNGNAGVGDSRLEDKFKGVWQPDIRERPKRDGSEEEPEQSPPKEKPKPERAKPPDRESQRATLRRMQQEGTR